MLHLPISLQRGDRSRQQPIARSSDLPSLTNDIAGRFYPMAFNYTAAKEVSTTRSSR